MNSVWRWIDPKTVRKVHDHQVAEHGGLKGVRNDGAVESVVRDKKTLLFTAIRTLPRQPRPMLGASQGIMDLSTATNA